MSRDRHEEGGSNHEFVNTICEVNHFLVLSLQELVTEVGVSLSSRGQAGDADAESESKGGGGQDGFKEGFHCRSPQNCFR
jgi:hypothetical protein